MNDTMVSRGRVSALRLENTISGMSVPFGIYTVPLLPSVDFIDASSFLKSAHKQEIRP